MKKWGWPITRLDRQSPAEQFAAVQPDDDVTLDPPARFFYVGEVGDLVLEGADGHVATFVAAQGYIWASARRVLAASTCGAIVGCW